MTRIGSVFSDYGDAMTEEEVRAELKRWRAACGRLATTLVEVHLEDHDCHAPRPVLMEIITQDALEAADELLAAETGPPQ